MRRLTPVLLLLLVVFSSSAAYAQQTNVESGKFRLHKFQQDIGEETYTIDRTGGTLSLKDDFKFVDRGSPVPLSTSWTGDERLATRSFSITGRTSRGSTIDTEITVNGPSAVIREGKDTRQVTVPHQFFTIAGYSPAAMQMMLMRYITANGVKGSIETLPGGPVTAEYRGEDKVTVGGQAVVLDRYIISGLIWGRESLWMDKEHKLAALIGVDAEFDHFEAVGDKYEPLLNFFVSKGAEDGMAALSELSDRISPRAKERPLVITNVNLIDGTGKPVVADAAVVVENGRITAVGPRSSVAIPKGSETLDGRGRYLLPGLWDMHAHFEQVEWGPVYLAAGVTTVRDVGNEFDFIRSVRDSVKNGKGLGPRIFMAGIVDGDGPQALGVVRANTADEGIAVVHKYHDAGFQQIKIYSSMKADVLKVICAEAHKLGMTVTGHIPNGMDAIQGVEAGMDQINHVQYIPRVLLPADYKRQPGVVPTIDFNSPRAKDTIAFFQAHHTVFDPTMVIFEWLYHPSDQPFANFEPGAAKLPKELDGPINNTGVPPAQASLGKAQIEQYLSVIKALHEAGLQIVAGTDQVVPGHSVRREIELYVRAGFTPMEAIQAATIVPARVMKVDSDLGTIEKGKQADMILVDGNPLEKISNIRNCSTVITGGRIFDTAKLWQSVDFKP